MVWLHLSTLTIAVVRGSDEDRFASNLAAQLRAQQSSLSLDVARFDTAAKATAAFNRHNADLAIVRSDGAIPASANALAILEHDVVLVVERRQQRGRPLATNPNVAVPGGDPQRMALAAAISTQYGIGRGRAQIHAVAEDEPLAELFGPGRNSLAVLVVPLSRLSNPEWGREIALHLQGLALKPVDSSKALERKMAGLHDETLEAGLLSGAPKIPAEDLETVSTYRILVAQEQLPEFVVGPLLHFLFENKAAIAVRGRFATSIEPPDLARNALIAAHSAAIAFVNETESSLFDRYGDLIYLAVSAIGFGSFKYTQVFRRRSRQSKRLRRLIGALRQLAPRIRTSTSPDDLRAVEDELEQLVDTILAGITTRSVPSKGTEAFRLAYDHIVRQLAARRHEMGGAGGMLPPTGPRLDDAP